jgi:hypothetical protein
VVDEKIPMQIPWMKRQRKKVQGLGIKIKNPTTIEIKFINNTLVLNEGVDTFLIEF